MKSFLIALFLCCGGVSYSQVQSTHIVNNFTQDTVYLMMDLKDKAQDPGRGTQMFLLPPYSATEISSANDPTQFIDPTVSYTLRLKWKGKEHPMDPNKTENWVLEKKEESAGVYSMTIQ